MSEKINFLDGSMREFETLAGASLRSADLRDADLRGVNLDYSCWPLWCGSLSPKIDKQVACQLLYHVMMAMQGCDDEDVRGKDLVDEGF